MAIWKPNETPTTIEELRDGEKKGEKILLLNLIEFLNNLELEKQKLNYLLQVNKWLKI